MRYNIITKKLIMHTCPTKMCHASTLIKLNNNDFICAWFGGSVEGNGDTGIYLSKSYNNVFEKPRLIASSNEAHWNPVLFKLDYKTIILFYKVGMLISKWKTMFRISYDEGDTFGEEQELVVGDEGGRGPVRAKAIRLSDGTIVAPSSNEDGEWHSFIDLSYDNGKTWQKSNKIFISKKDFLENNTFKDSAIPVSEQSFKGRGVIQPTLWESSPNNVHAFMRSSEGKVFRADSFDNGKTFSDAYATNLPNNNSGIDICKLQNGNLIFAHNPVGKNWGSRSPLRLAYSKDNGLNFETLFDIETKDGEFSYPAIIADNNTVYLSYTYNRENIAFCEIEIIN